MAEESLSLRRTINRQAGLGHMDIEEASRQLSHRLQFNRNAIRTGAKTKDEAVKEMRGFLVQTAEVLPQYVSAAQLKHECVILRDSSTPAIRPRPSSQR